MSVTSVERAFQLLRAVPTSDGTLSGLSRETGLPVATVSRLMSALEKAGAVLRNDEKVYRIGPALVELASSEPGPYDLLALATAHLSELAAQTNETAGVVEAVGTELVHLGQVATEHDVSVRDWTGFRVAAHSGAVGFVLMAFWDDAVLDEYLAGELEVFSPATMTDPEQIRTRLEVVRAQGWLWSTDEYALGVTTVAAAVLDREG
ncbi:MAG: IclR family transcriptional regulator, partial [Actinomycetia bacterium]|nr:IclR family transcriptional regulator [Actinomycetes bacterium]